MIRIETTAEFDAEGRFTVSGQTTEPISPGVHPIAITIGETRPPLESTVEPPSSTLIERNGLVLINAQPQFDANIDIVEMIRQVREEREQFVLGGWEP